MILRTGCDLVISALLILLTLETANCSILSGISDIPCKEDATCLTQLVGSFCDIPSNTDEGRCTCSSGIINDRKDQCLDGNVLIGNPCEKDEQCVGYSEIEPVSQCLTGSSERVCACRAEFVHSNALDKCLPIVNNLEGDFCEEIAQCHEGTPGNLSICDLESPGSPRKVCRCNNDAINGPTNPENLHNRCFKKAESVGDVCEIHEQCTPNLRFSRCINNVCMCNEYYIPSEDLSVCLEMKNLGESCTNDVQCIVQFASCVFGRPSDQNGVCTCFDNYVKPGNENKCYEKVLIDQTCQISDQCPQNSRCNNNRCTCNTDFTPGISKTECLPYINVLGGACQEPSQCLRLSHTECMIPPDGGAVTTRCICVPEKFVPSEIVENTCVEIVREKNLPCNEDVQCTTSLGRYAFCRDDVCQCRPTYGYYNGTCHIPAKLFEPCQIVEQCYVGINNLTVCHGNPEDFQKRCQCLPGTEPVFDNTKCYDLTKKVGEKCTSHEECLASIMGQVYCDPLAHTCACEIGYHATASNRMCSNGVSSYHLKSFIVPLSLLLITISGVKTIILNVQN